VGKEETARDGMGKRGKMLATAERGRQQGARAVNGGETRDKWLVVVVVEKRSSHFPKGANVLSSHLKEQKCTCIFARV